MSSRLGPGVRLRPTRRIRRLAALALALVAVALVAAGCGGGSSGDAHKLLDEAFSHPIHSANLTLNLQVTVDNVSSLRQPITASLGGPFQSNGGKTIPSFDWNFNLAFSGRSFSGTLTSTGTNAYIGVEGQNYEIGAGRVAQLNQAIARQAGQSHSLKSFGIDPQNWVTNASVEGSAQVDGTQTTHVRAGLDVGRMLNDLDKTINSTRSTVGGVVANRLTPQEIAQIKKVIQAPTFDVYVAKSDQTLRRVAVGISFKVPSSSQQQLRGATGGKIDFALDLANVGQPQTIQAPSGAQPLSSLLNALRGGASGL